MNTAPALTAADLTAGTVVRETTTGNLYVLTDDASVKGEVVDFKGTRVTKAGRMMKPRPHDVYSRSISCLEVVSDLPIRN